VTIKILLNGCECKKLHRKTLSQDDFDRRWSLDGVKTVIKYKCNQSELVGDVAVPVSVHQAVLFWALRSPDARPRLNWHRSSSTVLSQVCLGRPGRCLQFLGAGDMQACRAREWSWDLSARATWPNYFRCLIRTVSDSSGWPVRRHWYWYSTLHLN